MLVPHRPSWSARVRLYLGRWLPVIAGLAIFGGQVLLVYLTERTRTPPPIVILGVSTPTARPGEELTIRWATRHVRDLSTEPDIGLVETPSGSRRVRVHGTTEFRATGVGPGGKETVLRVVQVPTPANGGGDRPSGPSMPPPRARVRSSTTPLAPPAPRGPEPTTQVSPGHRRVFDLVFNCEETVSAAIREPVPPSEHLAFYVSWELNGVVNAKGYELAPPVFDPNTRTIATRYSFTGLDRVWLSCPGRGTAKLTLVAVPLLRVPPPMNLRMGRTSP